MTLSEVVEYFNKYMRKTEYLINVEDNSALKHMIKNEAKKLFNHFNVSGEDLISFEDF